MRASTASALVLYVAVSALVASGVLPAPPDQAASIYILEGGQLGFVLLANIFGLSLVGALAERLATRLDIAGESLKQAEALNRDIVHSLTSGLLTLDTNGVVRTANPAAAAMLGASPDTLIGEPGTRFLPLVGPTVARSEGSGQRTNGDVFPVGFSTAPLLGDQGTLVLFTDLTEIQSLRESAERSERLAVLGRLSSALAHEIRNPLGSISGSVQLVRDAEGLGSEDRSLLDIVLREVERLNGLVSQMLDVARPPTLRRDPTNLRALCEEVITIARSDDYFLSLEVEVIGDAGNTLIDADRFRQLLWNLFKNAAAASPEGGAIRFELASDEDKVTHSRSRTKAKASTKPTARIFLTHSTAAMTTASDSGSQSSSRSSRATVETFTSNPARPAVHVLSS